MTTKNNSKIIVHVVEFLMDSGHRTQLVIPVIEKNKPYDTFEKLVETFSSLSVNPVISITYNAFADDVNTTVPVHCAIDMKKVQSYKIVQKKNLYND